MDKLSVAASLRRDFAQARHAAKHLLDTLQSAGPCRIGYAAERLFMVLQESTGRFGACKPPILGASRSSKPLLDTLQSAGPCRIGYAAERLFMVLQESTGRFGACKPPILGASLSAKPNLRPHVRRRFIGTTIPD